ncbi:hypothetical protein IWQ49_001336 [Labrenzia sp. EL_126]|nr:hypothetical protein [Labrenzia sp. EL_126]
MFDLIKGPVKSGKVAKLLKSCSLALVLAFGGTGLVTMAFPEPAEADAFYIGTGGVGFAFGTGGYRGGVFYGYRGGFAGPPFRPYGPPYYYHPYDRRAYPYRSRVYVAPRRYVRPPLYIAPRRRHVGQPQRVPFTKTGLAPFTPQWVAYCSRKFKSFNPNTGTYLAYSGRYRFCR